jgi:hypothetical protein
MSIGSRLVEFPVAAGKVLVEVDAPDLGTQPAARFTKEVAKESLELALAQVNPAAEAMVSQHPRLTPKSETVSLDFDVKFIAGANAFIADSSIEGSIEVTLN